MSTDRVWRLFWIIQSELLFLFLSSLGLSNWVIRTIARRRSDNTPSARNAVSQARENVQIVQIYLSLVFPTCANFSVVLAFLSTFSKTTINWLIIHIFSKFKLKWNKRHRKLMILVRNKMLFNVHAYSLALLCFVCLSVRTFSLKLWELPAI